MANLTGFDYYRYERRELGWNTPAEYMEFVHPHWKQFEAPNPFLHYMLGVFYIIFMFCSLVGNGVVIWVFASAKSLRTPSNLFVINLAVLDFLMMLKTPVFIVNSFNEGPIWGKTGCDFLHFLGLILVLVVQLRMRQLRLIDIEGFLTTCSFDYITENSSTRAFVGTIFFTSYVIPMILIIYFYSQIVGHVRQHEETLRAQAKKMNVATLRSGKDDQEQSAEVRIAKVCIGLFSMFIISWTPYAIVALLCAFGNRAAVTPLVSMIPALTCKAVACIDPWIYAINHPRYRLELQKRLPWFCIHEPEPNNDSASVNSEKTVATTTPS